MIRGKSDKRLMTMPNNKKKLFEMFERVNKINLKEWYDDDYYEKPQYPKGMGDFKNIDWKALHDTLLANTEEGEGKTTTTNFISVNVGDLTDYDGMLSPEELGHLDKWNLIYIDGAFPIIDDPKYRDYMTFLKKAEEVWDKDAPIEPHDPPYPEAPYMRGREDSNE